MLLNIKKIICILKRTKINYAIITILKKRGVTKEENKEKLLNEINEQKHKLK